MGRRWTLWFGVSISAKFATSRSRHPPSLQPEVHGLKNSAGMFLSRSLYRETRDHSWHACTNLLQGNPSAPAPCRNYQTCACVLGLTGGGGSGSSECARPVFSSRRTIAASVQCGSVGVWESHQSGLQRVLRKNEEIADR